jgi:6-phosphogluconolactonase
VRIQVFSTPELLGDAVARHIVECAADAISSGGRFAIALAGGSTPRAAYQRLADRALAPEVDWKRTHVLWGDERCVPPDDPRSNYRMAKEVLLDRVPIPREQIHRIRGEEEPERAAVEYESRLRTLLPRHSERSEESGTLDLVLLGLGEDGHTASLFPGQSAVHETSRWATAVPGPDKLWRVTLTPPVLNAARNVAFVVSGANKAARLQQVIEGPYNSDLLPAQAIRPLEGRLTWMVDEAAAGRLRSYRVAT